MARVQQIRAFEQRQTETIGRIVSEQLHVLELGQALALNAVHDALEQPQTGDASTPVFFLIQTSADSLRIAEVALGRGYGTAAVQCCRDAVEAAALALLLAKAPSRTEQYWLGAELSPGTVRTELQGLGLAEDFVLMLWGLHDFLSLFAHPNVERLAYVMDEVDYGGGQITRTFRAGGTNDPGKLLTFANLCVAAVAAVVILIPEALADAIPDSRIGEIRAARSDILRTTMGPLRAALVSAAARRERPGADPVAAAHARRLRRRIPAMDASFTRGASDSGFIGPFWRGRQALA